MNEIRIDEIVIKRQESSLVICDLGKPGLNIKMESNHLPKLIEFLNSHGSDPGLGEKRIGFRVPIADLSEPTRKNFSIGIELDGNYIAATALDVSITGVQIELIGHKVLIGDRFSAILKYRDQIATIGAKVVRTNGTRLCLHFPSSLTHGKLHPPEALVNVYRALEMDWLKARVS